MSTKAYIDHTKGNCYCISPSRRCVFRSRRCVFWGARACKIKRPMRSHQDQHRIASWPPKRCWSLIRTVYSVTNVWIVISISKFVGTVDSSWKLLAARFVGNSKNFDSTRLRFRGNDIYNRTVKLFRLIQNCITMWSAVERPRRWHCNGILMRFQCR